MPDGQELPEAATVRPGDTVILRCARSLTLEQIDATKQAWRDQLPDVDIKVVCDLDQLTVYRPEPAAVRPALSLFDYSHLPPHLQAASRPIADAVKELAAILPEGSPEGDVALRKILEGKDAAVRALVEGGKR